MFGSVSSFLGFCLGGLYLLLNNIELSSSLKEDGVRLSFFQRKLHQTETNDTNLEYICFEGCNRECDKGCNGGCDDTECNAGCDGGCTLGCDSSCDTGSNSGCDSFCDEGCNTLCDDNCQQVSCDEGCVGGCDTGCTEECSFVNISLITGEYITYEDEDGNIVTDWDFTGRKDGAVNLSNSVFYVLLSSVAAFGWQLLQ